VPATANVISVFDFDLIAVSFQMRVSTLNQDVATVVPQNDSPRKQRDTDAYRQALQLNRHLSATHALHVGLTC
jgi:hypothetical protein